MWINERIIYWINKEKIAEIDKSIFIKWNNFWEFIWIRWSLKIEWDNEWRIYSDSWSIHVIWDNVSQISSRSSKMLILWNNTWHIDLYFSWEVNIGLENRGILNTNLWDINIKNDNSLEWYINTISWEVEIWW